MVAWLADLNAAGGRPGLHGRVLTQLECCETVLITGGPEGHIEGTSGRLWLQVAAPMQPSRLDTRGYPGWVLAAHVAGRVPACPQVMTSSDHLATGVDAEAFIAQARTHLGTGYLWGGLCDAGLDCSGLVHLSLRRLGVLFPRDADDQYDACEHIPAGDARPGDLLFFAHEGRRPHHVGIATGPGRMLHAPETGSVIIEEAIDPARRSTLIGAGHVPALSSPARSMR
jgi:hypothetical protein